MKLVAVTVVRNESDIIEAFVRHTAAWTDHHLVVDLGSTDGTRQTLASLLREGLALTLFGGVRDTDPVRLTNRLIKMAFDAHGADWVLLLGADEFLAGADRPALERELAGRLSDEPVGIGTRNYVCTTMDDPNEQNPILRIRHRQHGASASARMFVRKSPPSPADPSARPDVSSVTGVWLARFAARTAQQQVVQVVTGELQRLSRGAAHAGLNTHNRLGYQLLAEDPDAFFSIAVQPPENLMQDPVAYFGGPLRYSGGFKEIVRSARALLPFLENLARSHGQLMDRIDGPIAVAEGIDPLHRLDAANVPSLPNPDVPRFSGFVPMSGWQRQEGPLPSAFLPAFHWGTAPETAVAVRAKADGIAQLRVEVLTYAERQVTTIVLNGIELSRHVFTQVNQRETLTAALNLRAGENRLVFRHRSWLNSRSDPRKLAIIFLALQVDEV